MNTNEQTKISWNYKIGVSNVLNKLTTLSTPSIPSGFGKEYSFPETSKITSTELGDWMMKLAGWKSYTIKLLTKADVERIILDESYDVIISKGLAAADKDGKKVTKDVAIGRALFEIENFKELKIKLIEKKAEVESLKRIIDIYTTQLDAISREISRRSADMKATGQGLL